MKPVRVLSEAAALPGLGWCTRGLSGHADRLVCLTYRLRHCLFCCLLGGHGMLGLLFYWALGREAESMADPVQESRARVSHTSSRSADCWLVKGWLTGQGTSALTLQVPS